MNQTLSPPDADRLLAAFRDLSPLLLNRMPQPPRQTYSLNDLQAAFDALAGPLDIARQQGGLLNIWAIAGLKRDEVRTASALAGLWLAAFGGAASARFLAAYLQIALDDVEWERELAEGYRVEAECHPLGLRSDRLDLLVETPRHIVAIEVKIDAGLGPEQLERYRGAIEWRAALQRRTAHVILLAPFASATARSTTWSDLADAAEASVPRRAADRNFPEQLIASFAEHVRRLTKGNP